MWRRCTRQPQTHNAHIHIPHHSALHAICNVATQQRNPYHTPNNNALHRSSRGSGGTKPILTMCPQYTTTDPHGSIQGEEGFRGGVFLIKSTPPHGNHGNTLFLSYLKVKIQDVNYVMKSRSQESACFRDEFLQQLELHRKYSHDTCFRLRERVREFP